ncbi:hypothetical protein RFI_27527 [Reticulomyxa filosa]|uniref:EGF-like domain-containing protein n=1 Tax=Reticulomyxa filosa TaxID=46433 RepID=X6M777_RETFI|nr:hypothetical protein RFI_27527 [Reticulomyxa filosa]|eukprot:ETO09848.1 hypothetical protein RFI_27527 [Reticulomyxa filosa]
MKLSLRHLVVGLFGLVSCNGGGEAISKDFTACTFTFIDNNQINVYYNLSDFRLDDKAYQVYDSEPNTFKYLFNFCNTIPSSWYKNTSRVPTSCYTAAGPCQNINSQNSHQCDDTFSIENKLRYLGEITYTLILNCSFYRNKWNTTALALQLQAMSSYEENPNAKCYWLGAQMNKDSMPDYNVSLLDPNDAGRGMLFEYMNGAWCSSAGINRRLRVKLQCPDSNREYFDPDIANSLSETVLYTICIEDFIFVITTLLNTKEKEGGGEEETKGKYKNNFFLREFGIFFFLFALTIKKKKITLTATYSVRCLCDDGWTGDTCDQRHSDVQKVEENHTGIITAIVICIILLVVVLGLSAWICYQIRLHEEKAKIRDGGLLSPMLVSEKESATTTSEGLSMGQVNPDTAPRGSLIPSEPEHDDPDATKSTDPVVSIN